MSLEAKIDALTIAVEANTAMLAKVISGREEALTAASKLAEATTTKRTTKKSDPIADAKPEPEPKKPEPAAEPAPAPSASAKKASEKDKLAEVQSRYGAYINAKDPAERKERLGILRQINEFFGVERISNVGGTDIDLALDMIGDLEKGIMPKELAGEPEDDGGDLV